MANAANGTNWFKSRIFWCSIEIEDRLLLIIASRDSSSVSSYGISPEGRMACSAVINKIKIIYQKMNKLKRQSVGLDSI